MLSKIIKNINIEKLKNKTGILLSKNIIRILIQNILIIDNSIKILNDKSNLTLIIPKINNNINLFKVFFNDINVYTKDAQEINKIEGISINNKDIELINNSDCIIILWPYSYYYNTNDNDIKKNIKFDKISNYKILLILSPLFINIQINKKLEKITKPINFKNIDFYSNLHIFYNNKK